MHCVELDDVDKLTLLLQCWLRGLGRLCHGNIIEGKMVPFWRRVRRFIAFREEDWWQHLINSWWQLFYRRYTIFQKAETKRCHGAVCSK